MADEFESIVALDDAEIDLAEAALVIARDEYPSLDITAYLDRLDVLAEGAASRLGDGDDATDIISTLNDYLFEELGFQGDMEDYYDPRNNLLNEVIDRRRGIPISLSILYMDLGRRLGLDLEGVSFPGHFLVRFNLSRGTVILDPFFGGVSLSEDELQFRLSQFEADDEPDDLEDLLAPASNKAIIERVLRNLRGIYMQNETHEKALAMSNRILTLSPGDPREYLMRGTIYRELECFTPALADYRQYMALAPEPEEGDHIREAIIELQDAVRRLH